MRGTFQWLAALRYGKCGQEVVACWVSVCFPKRCRGWWWWCEARLRERSGRGGPTPCNRCCGRFSSAFWCLLTAVSSLRVANGSGTRAAGNYRRWTGASGASQTDHFVLFVHGDGPPSSGPRTRRQPRDAERLPLSGPSALAECDATHRRLSGRRCNLPFCLALRVMSHWWVPLPGANRTANGGCYE